MMKKNRGTNEGETLKEMLADYIDLGEYYYAQIVQERLNTFDAYKFETTIKETNDEMHSLRCKNL